MTTFPIHDVASAPEGSKAILENLQKTLGHIPGLFGALAESPAAITAYPVISDLFDKTSLSPAEQQLLLIAISVENECHFCVPAHTVIAKNVAKVDADLVNAVRESRSTGDAKIDALVTFAKELVKARGHASDAQIEAFLAAGYNKAQVLEVILGVTLKTFSNYVSHITNPPLGAFQSEAWSPAQD